MPVAPMPVARLLAVCFLAALLLPHAQGQLSSPEGDAGNRPRFVWKDDAGSGRQERVLFRRTFDLMETGPALSAEIHLFADSRYHLH
ncbi:MAG TPA: hypothetical protein ENO05_08120, partial [Bacteroides sp.]|nr:hypothetical protein [Bacteroides sp.]